MSLDVINVEKLTRSP